tara:strand:+ start:881 stop:2068 length:1188 start_codon:yes stop_codon:yes gene_type:complete
MFKLTKRSVEALESRASEYFVWDSEVAGFGVRVFPSGRKTYLVQYRVGRRTKRITIAQHGVLTSDEARKQARKLLGEIAQGGDPSGDKKERSTAPTVASLIDRFITDYAAHHVKPSTARDYASIAARLIKPQLGLFHIADVTRADIVALHHSLRDTPYQANRMLSLVSKMFNLAEDWGLRAEGSNPVRRIKKFREEEKKRYLSEAEQARLGEVLGQALEDGTETVHAVSAILLLLFTGCRLGEIRTLRWEWVTARHLELPDSKTGRRRIPLPRAAAELLENIPRREGNPHVIIGARGDGPLNDLQKPWQRLRHAAGLDDVRIHDLRHTYASTAVMNGIDPFELKEIMGHRNLQTTLRYAHFADEKILQAADSIATRLAGKVNIRQAERPALRIVR